MNAREALIRFIDAQRINYPHGVPIALMEQVAADRSKAVPLSAKLKLVILAEDQEKQADLLEGIVTKGLKLSLQEVEIVSVADRSSLPSSLSISHGEHAIALLGKEDRRFAELPHVLSAYTLSEMAEDAGKKKAFWKDLQVFIASYKGS